MSVTDGVSQHNPHWSQYFEFKGKWEIYRRQFPYAPVGVCVCAWARALVYACVYVCASVFVVDSVAFFLASQLGHVYIELLVGPRDVQRFSVWAMAFSSLLYGFAKSAKL